MGRGREGWAVDVAGEARGVVPESTSRLGPWTTRAPCPWHLKEVDALLGIPLLPLPIAAFPLLALSSKDVTLT